MWYRLVADILVVFHFIFILYVLLGGLLALKWPRTVYLHIPAVIWGIFIEFSGWICPLTPLENHFRHLGGEAGYAGGYIEHYLLPLIYPSELTRSTQFVLGVVVIMVNLLAYGVLLWMRKKSQKPGQMDENR